MYVVVFALLFFRIISLPAEYDDDDEDRHLAQYLGTVWSRVISPTAQPMLHVDRSLLGPTTGMRVPPVADYDVLCPAIRSDRCRRRNCAERESNTESPATRAIDWRPPCEEIEPRRTATQPTGCRHSWRRRDRPSSQLVCALSEPRIFVPQTVASKHFPQNKRPPPDILACRQNNNRHYIN